MEINDKPHVEIGSRVRWIRENLAFMSDQNEFADKYNWTRKTVSSWEVGRRRIPPESAEILCEDYDVTMDFIYRGKTSALPQNILKLLSSNPLDR